MSQRCERLYSPESLPPGMLSSPQISQCLQAGLLIESWRENCLMPATYEMRLGSFACDYVNGLRVAWQLGHEDNLNHNVHKTLIFKPNSLTFITTIESFRLPCDIVARFNLRASWVRKGLLLGTAPIVDPEFYGRLLIPIHNFSSNPVQINYGEKIIAVEFTKTLPPAGGYVDNADPEGNIEKYLELTGIVESSVSTALSRHESLYRDIQSKTKIFSIAGGITLFLLICATMTLMLNIFNLAENTRKTAAQAQAVVDTFAEKNRAVFERYDEEMRELKFTVQKLRDELAARRASSPSEQDYSNIMALPAEGGE